MKSVKEHLVVDRDIATTERLIYRKYATPTSNLGFETRWIGSTTRNQTISARLNLPEMIYLSLFIILLCYFLYIFKHILLLVLYNHKRVQ
jgi:hypothetical protein